MHEIAGANNTLFITPLHNIDPPPIFSFHFECEWESMERSTHAPRLFVLFQLITFFVFKFEILEHRSGAPMNTFPLEVTLLIFMYAAE